MGGSTPNWIWYNTWAYTTQFQINYRWLSMFRSPFPCRYGKFWRGLKTRFSRESLWTQSVFLMRFKWGFTQTPDVGPLICCESFWEVYVLMIYIYIWYGGSACSCRFFFGCCCWWWRQWSWWRWGWSVKLSINNVLYVIRRACLSFWSNKNIGFVLVVT